MTGVGTIDLGTKQIGFRVEPKLVMTTEGQGRATDPVGLGIPVMIEGPWGSPRIYPEMQGILDNPDAAYAKLKEMGKGLFGPNGAGLGAAIGSLLGGQQGAAGGQQVRPADRPAPSRRSARRPARRDHRQSAAAGLERAGPEPGPGRVGQQAAPRPSGQRSIPAAPIAGPGTGRPGADRAGRARRPRAAERDDRPAGQPADERRAAAAVQSLRPPLLAAASRARLCKPDDESPAIPAQNRANHAGRSHTRLPLNSC